MIKILKKIFKRMFPPSRLESVNKRLEVLDKKGTEAVNKIDTLIKHIEESSNSIKNEIEKGCNSANERLEKVTVACNLMEKNGEEIKRLIKSNGNGIVDIKRYLQRKVLYNNDHERKVITSFYDYYNRDDFKDKFLALVKNLDAESIKTIVRILKRQQMIKGTEGEKLDILTTEEQDKRIKIKEEFDFGRLKICDDLYCYNNYFLPVNHFEVSVFIDKHGIDLIEDISKTNNRDIIDAGGFIGDSILILSPLTRKKVYSFEAVTECFELMQKTISINKIENAVAIKSALGARNEVIDINVAGSVSSFNVPIADDMSCQEKVMVITLDEYVEKNDLDVGLIKVDIEGYEQEFLKGAEKTIKKCKPIMLISIYHNADDFFNIKPLIESWGLDYKFKIHKPKDLSISREVLLIAEI